eukprot:1329655-Amorphochlora_amoeboformis.AAC.1
MEMEEEKTTGPAGILERMYTKEEKDADGRVRRKVVFKHEMKEQGHQMDSDADSEGDSEADLEDDDEEEEQDGQEIEDDEEVFRVKNRVLVTVWNNLVGNMRLQVG